MYAVRKHFITVICMQDGCIQVVSFEDVSLQPANSTVRTHQILVASPCYILSAISSCKAARGIHGLQDGVILTYMNLKSAKQCLVHASCSKIGKYIVCQLATRESYHSEQGRAAAGEFMGAGLPSVTHSITAAAPGGARPLDVLIASALVAFGLPALLFVLGISLKACPLKQRL